MTPQKQPSRALTIARLEGIKEWSVRFYDSGHTFMGAEAMGAIDTVISVLRQPIQVELDKSTALDSAQNSPKSNCFVQEPEIAEKVSIGSHQYYDSVNAPVRDERNGERQNSDAVRNVPGWTLIKDAVPDDSMGDFYTLAVMTNEASQGIASYGFHLASYVAKHAGWFIAWMILPPMPEVPE